MSRRLLENSSLPLAIEKTGLQAAVWEEHHQLVGREPKKPQLGSLIPPLATARLGTESQR